MKPQPEKTVFGFPVQIMDALPNDIVIVGKVTVILQCGRLVDAVIDGGVIRFGEGHAQG